MREGRKEVAVALRGAGGELGYDEVAASAELCELAKRGSLDLLKVLLDCGCPVNAIDYDARTCLHLASSCGSLNICELLIERQADINALDRWGGTPLRDVGRCDSTPAAHECWLTLGLGGAQAVRQRHNEVAAFLLEHGGNLNYNEVEASGELCEMAKTGKLEAVQLLLVCGCSVNAKDYDARTCLHLAASTGNLAICEALLASDANVNAADRWGGTPLRDVCGSGPNPMSCLAAV